LFVSSQVGVASRHRKLAGWRDIPWRASVRADRSCMIDKTPMNELGKMLLGVGLVIALAGALILLASRTGLPLGRLPGDISYKGKNVSFYFPLGTSILISVILSVLLYILSRFRR
jgi:hypothetical protein